MSSRRWVFDPGRGGIKIEEAVKNRTEKRILHYAETHLGGRYTRLDIRFRRQFCYVDAYTETEPHRLRNTPVHLFRLRFFGDEEEWGLAFYSYAHEKYELSVFPTGEFRGPPELALQTAAEFHL